MKRFVCLLFLCLAFQGIVLSQESDTALFVVVIDGKRAFINREGKVVLTYEQAIAESDKPVFNEGLAPVKINGKGCYINRNGKVVIKTDFDEVHSFLNGYAAVEIIRKKIVTPATDDNEEVSYEYSKFGFIDKSGKVVVKPQYDEFHGFDGEGMGAVAVNGKWGFIDYSGKIIIEPQFYDTYSFAEGFGCVEINADGDYAFIDKTGKIVSPPGYKYHAERFSDGLLPAFDGKKSGYFDKNWQIAIPFQFDVASRFSEGLAVVKIGKKYGYIDKTGKVVVAPQYDLAIAFSEGLAAVSVNKRFGYIDQTGRMIIEPKFLSAHNFRNGLAAVISEERADEFKDFWTNRWRGYTENWDYVDKTGKYVWRTKYKY